MSSSVPQRSRLVKRSTISGGTFHSNSSSSIASVPAPMSARPSGSSSSVVGGGGMGGGPSQGAGRGRLWDDEDSQDDYDEFISKRSGARAHGTVPLEGAQGNVAGGAASAEEYADYDKTEDEVEDMPSLRRFLGSRHDSSSGFTKKRPVISHDNEGFPPPQGYAGGSYPSEVSKPSKVPSRPRVDSSDIEVTEVGKRRRDSDSALIRGPRREAAAGVATGPGGSGRVPADTPSFSTSSAMAAMKEPDHLEVCDDLEDSADEDQSDSDLTKSGGAEAGIRSCVLMRQGMDALAAVAHFFARIGKELLLEARGDGLTLRTLNDAKTAFACTQFRSEFSPQSPDPQRLPPGSPFEGANGGGSRSSGNIIEMNESFPGIPLLQDYEVVNEPFLAKLQLKPLVCIVKGLRRMRMLELRSEVVQGVEHQVILELLCDLGIRRTHRLVYQDCPSLSAVFDASGASSFTVEVAVFKQVLEQVGHSAQVLLTASTNTFKIASFHPELLVRGLGASLAGATTRRHLSTEMTLPVHEFLSYSYIGTGCGSSDKPTESQPDAYGDSEELVLSTRELKSVISFCEATETPEFTLFYTSGGRPCKVVVESAACTMTLVLATLGLPSAQDAPHSAASQEPVQQE